jgi:CheY-like chemotaxis protein
MEVLIVDDEQELRESLEEFLVDHGYAAVSAANGAEALARLEAGAPPRLVILDLRMPVIDGNELFRRMRADPRLAQVPVVVSTSDPARAPRGVQIMRKPISLSSLLQLVRRYCPQPA